MVTTPSAAPLHIDGQAPLFSRLGLWLNCKKLNDNGPAASEKKMRDRILIPGEQNYEVASARRRLIRGTFAAPAVLALHSGSVFAAASSLRCVNAQAANPIYPGYVGGADAYVRVQLYAVYESATSPTVLAWYLSGSSVDAARFDRGNKITNRLLMPSKWQQVELNPPNAKLVGLPLDVAPGSMTTPLKLGPTYVALRVAPQSTGGEVDIIGLVDGTTTGTAVTGSCWTSFAIKLA